MRENGSFLVTVPFVISDRCFLGGKMILKILLATLIFWSCSEGAGDKKEDFRALLTTQRYLFVIFCII